MEPAKTTAPKRQADTQGESASLPTINTTVLGQDSDIPTKPKPSEITESVEQILQGPIFLVWGQMDLELQQACLDFAKKHKQVKRLNVLVVSLGGDPNLTFNSVNILRSKCDSLVAYIHCFETSAATLLCLGTDEIVMRLGAHLGPLDMQVQDPRNSPESISALSGYQALEAVANFLHGEIDVTVKQLYLKARTNISDSLSYAMQLVSSMARPLFEQVNPLDLGNFSNSLAVSEKYGVELLCRYGNKTLKEAKSIAGRLVRDYPSHSFVIDLAEAIKIGLRAREPNADELRIIDEIYEGILHNKSYQKHGLIEKPEEILNGHNE
jgi:hypothetical protein